ncbi:HD-GYP domain-containing protein [Marinobacter sp. ANT_B65]|uniref:HD-GYP domain-containing protein n=1 Tax=Marinobacter sp. ANT_B65 TaxID=2039467 RepID=UPI000BBE7C4B|nr:HD-GYP domain-containing protein [Marinobacter sp. ANT_B65]PCM46084.1 phosphohydrolase [Marinobacter sp. ANT_B65]
MGVCQKKIAVHDLEVGMFVSDLDRPWHQTPFPIQGFHIRSQDDIRALVSHCKWVAIDIAESRDSVGLGEIGSSAFSSRRSRRGGGREELQLPPLRIKDPVTYQSVTTLKREMKASKKLLADATVELERLYDTFASEGFRNLRPVAAVVNKMVSSVIRQPDALLWLSRIQQHDDHVYRHALNTSVWALVCGRQLGLNEGLLNHLGLGCLLSQVGKTRLPSEMLSREGQYGPEEFALYRTYVAKGMEILEDSGLSRAVLSVVQGHRERHNGSGFPEGIRGDRIPLLAKVAGLAEFFESLIEPRESFAEPMTPAKAVALLYEMRNIEFQEDLVENFIQAIGVYPTGSLVELTDGQRGIVVSHSPKRRLWPRVMVMTDRHHAPLKSAKVVDLAKYNSSRAAAEALTIKECLAHGTGGLNPAAYGVSGEESRWSLGRLISR